MQVLEIQDARAWAVQLVVGSLKRDNYSDTSPSNLHENVWRQSRLKIANFFPGTVKYQFYLYIV